jgi:hypothetical protein
MDKVHFVCMEERTLWAGVLYYIITITFKAQCPSLWCAHTLDTHAFNIFSLRLPWIVDDSITEAHLRMQQYTPSSSDQQALTMINYLVSPSCKGHRKVSSFSGMDPASAVLKAITTPTDPSTSCCIGYQIERLNINQLAACQH